MCKEARRKPAPSPGLRIRTYRRRHDEPDRLAHGAPPGAAPEPSHKQGFPAQPHGAGGCSAADTPLPPLKIPRSDYLALVDLAVRHGSPGPSPAVEFLERELSRAEVIDDSKVPPDVATLRSHLVFHDEETGRDWVVTLGHPADVFTREDAISVLSPIGAALIGLSEGQSIEFQTADERSRRIALVRVLFQPRSAGCKP